MERIEKQQLFVPRKPEGLLGLSFFTELRIRLRTQFYYFFGKKKLKEKIAERQGKCNQCGVCCELGFFGMQCPFFDKETRKCRAFGTKKMPPTCRLFPFDKANRYEGRVPEIEKSCGYRWKE
ncbi:MAG: hypothetical protein WC634_03950 [archaeon]